MNVAFEQSLEEAPPESGVSLARKRLCERNLTGFIFNFCREIFMFSKRRIAILIAGLLLGTQVGLAALEQTSSAEGDSAQPQPLSAPAEQPAQVEQSPEQQAAQLGSAEASAPSAPIVAAAVPMPREDAFPPSADDMVWKPLPVQARYLEDRAASIQVASMGDAFPPSADEMPYKPLPALAQYLDQKETTNMNLTMYGSPAAGGPAQ
jgi:hypothetical protein